MTQLTEFMRDAQPIGPRPPVDPTIRRRKRRRRALVATISTVVVLALAGGYVGYTLTAPLPSPIGTTTAPTVASSAAATIAWPSEGESAISVTGAEGDMGAETDGVWASSGGGDPLPMASISKIITTLVVLDAKPLASATDAGPRLTFDKDDHALYDKYYLLGATIQPMPTGSSMTLRDALQLMLVVSACNYAEAVSSWAFGSQPAFLAAAKRWLAANGLTHTKMVEPTGIDSRNTSTPADLIALGKLAMANPTVAAIVGMDHLDVPGFPGSNTNNLLGVDGVRGIKTGTLDTSNLLYSAELNVGTEHPLEIVGVVLGGFSRDTVDRDVKALLDSITAGFHTVSVGSRGDEVGSYTTPWGAKARVVLGADAALLTWSDTPITATLTPTGLTSGTAGEQLGTVTWTSGSRTTSVPVVLDADIEPPSAWWRLTHPFELGT